MVLITIVNGVYKPIHNWVVPERTNIVASPGEQNFYTVVFAVSRTMGVMAQYIWSRAAPWRPAGGVAAG